MAGKKIYDITLRLKDIEHLFTKPDLSPFSEQYREYSPAAGIEYIADALYADPAYRSVRATILLPAERIEPGLVEATHQAIQVYCQARLREVRDTVRGLRWRGLKGFGRGAIFLILLGGASKWLDFARGLPLQIVSQGLLIGGTIVFEMAIWDYFIHAWQQQLDRQIYTKIMGMELTVKPDGEAAHVE